MFQKSKTKLALCAATGALAAATAAAPAVAAPAGDWQPSYKGRVIARTGLLVRDAPTQAGKVVDSLPYGTVVSIRCKVNSQVIDGNPRWYLLADGRWAWSSARYIENIGPAPRFC